MRTLADMTEEERAECVGMWCEDGEGLLCIYTGVDLGLGSGVYPEHRLFIRSFFDELTPRHDLPRAWAPDGTPPAGEWEEAEYLSHYKGMTDVYHYDGNPTHRRWVGEWEEA